MASASAAVRRKVCGGSLVISFTCVSFATRRVRSVRWGRHGPARAAEKVGGWVFRRAGTTFLFAVVILPASWGGQWSFLPEGGELAV